jgi:hypothetical protein
LIGSTRPIRFDLNITHTYSHSFRPNATASSSFIEELTATDVAIHEKKPGTIVSNEGLGLPRQGEEVVDPSLRTQLSWSSTSSKRYKAVSIPGYNIKVWPNDIPDPPAISYAGNFKEIIDDWMNLNCKASLVLNDARIPLAHWISVYRHNRPKVWNDIKGKWRSWRVS